MRVSERVSIVAGAILAASITSSLCAATMTKISDDALAPLRNAAVAKTIRIDKIALYDSKRSVIDVEEFDVWAPGGKVIIHGENGKVIATQDPPARRFFRGSVNGDKESFAYFSVDVKTGEIDGLINTSDKKVAIASKHHVRPVSRNNRVPVGEQEFEYYLTEDDPFAATPETTWQCALDKSHIAPKTEAIHATGLNGQPVTSQGITGTQSYAISVVVETDFEMYSTVAASNSLAVTNYVTNLTGAVSTIYNRDLHTNVLQTAVNVYTSVSDPWAATAPSAGLDELGDYYHNATFHPAGRTTSSVVMLSGKSIGGGVAWEGPICGPDFFQNGHWGGGYAWCGGIGNLGTTGFGTIPDVSLPNTTMPTGTQNFWPLAEYAHELGHNLGGHHTHCVAITDVERPLAGFTDASPATSASNQVDHCYAHEGLAGCFAGATDYIVGSQGTFKGSIMSYCHNVNAPQATGSRFTFGQFTTNDPSHNELDNYMLRAAGPLADPINAGLDGGARNIVSGVGAFTISAITAPTTVAPNSTGNIASITASPSAGATYDWQITGGTITGGQATNSITFTASAAGSVGLRATGYNTQFCGVTDTKSVAITAVLFNPPTNVEAHVTSATTALVSWTAATGTAPGRYNVYRSAGPDYTAYSQVGNTTSTSYSDAVSTGKAYLYKVRSADAAGNNESSDSNRDLATIIIYTNPTLTAGVSTVNAVDMIELRTAVDAVRTLYNIGAGAYGFATITAGTSTVYAEDMQELRVNLNTPITGMGFAAPTYTNTISPGTSIIRALDFTEARNAMR